MESKYFLNAGMRECGIALRLEKEQEFFHLAGIYLACLYRAMGHDVSDRDFPTKGDLALSLLEMLDYGQEMRLMLREVAATRQDPSSAREP